jgi:pectinesterase
MMAKDPHIIVTVKNPLDLDRPSEMVVLQWSELIRKCPTLTMAGIHVLEPKTQEEVVHQIIDVDQDGTPEELIFLSRFTSNETKQFTITASNSIPKTVEPLTDVRFVIPREDIAWENDRIAHRIYGPAMAKDVNNGIDVWTKRVRYPIIEKWYMGDEAPDSIRVSYHEDHGEGADFFSVGRTLGAGSCALTYGDSLYQPGVFTSYKILATGPIRAMFEVTYNPVRFGDKNISEVKRITLDAGNNLGTIEVTYRCDSSTGTVSFAAGIVKRKGVVSSLDSTHRWVGLWGPTNEKEENGSLGTGIVMTKRTYTGIKENDVHVLMHGTIDLGTTATYYTGAGWTRSGDFAAEKDWNRYLEEFARRIEQPLEVAIATVQ